MGRSEFHLASYVPSHPPGLNSKSHNYRRLRISEAKSCTVESFMKVGENSDIHWVLFDEENRVVGFHAKSGGLWFFLGRVRAILKAVLFRGLSEFIHRESDLYVFSIHLETRFLKEIYASTWILNVWKMIYEIFINYMTKILSLRLEITMCTLVSLGLLVKSVNSESRQIQVKESVVRRLHAILWSKLAGSLGGGVTSKHIIGISRCDSWKRPWDYITFPTQKDCGPSVCYLDQRRDGRSHARKARDGLMRTGRVVRRVTMRVANRTWAETENWASGHAECASREVGRAWSTQSLKEYAIGHRSVLSQNLGLGSKIGSVF
uniref:Uncharacterized protein n=1 Tax=Cucumis melo TaxID=3656 RepID=A0A9I9CVE8_CUCME